MRAGPIKLEYDGQDAGACSTSTPQAHYVEDYATPRICRWESSGEIRWTALLPSLPASVGGPLRLAGRNTHAAWRHGSLSNPGGVVRTARLPAGVRQTLFRPAQPGAGIGMPWVSFTKCCVLRWVYNRSQTFLETFTCELAGIDSASRRWRE